MFVNRVQFRTSSTTPATNVPLTLTLPAPTRPLPASAPLRLYASTPLHLFASSPLRHPATLDGFCDLQDWKAFEDEESMRHLDRRAPQRRRHRPDHTRHFHIVLVYLSMVDVPFV